MLKHLDWWTIGLVTFLVILGLVMQLSVAPTLFVTQFAFVVLGIAIFVGTTLIDPKIYAYLAKYFYFGSLIFLLLPFAIGEITRGASRWISVGSFTLQPSELIKPFLLISFARFLSTRKVDRPVEIIVAGVLLLVPFVIVFAQPDLGSALVIALAWVSIVATLGTPKKWLFATIGSLSILSPLTWLFLKGYQRTRFISFFNPSSDPLGTGYNVIQSIIAVGSGAIVGRGLGQGTQSHLRFLPENHTDFIFASLAEELGLFGVILVLLAFFILLFHFLDASGKCQSLFEKLTLTGAAGMLFFQVAVNIGMNLGLLPVTGIPLPLVSYGGSSLISTFLTLGIVNGIIVRSQKDSAQLVLR